MLASPISHGMSPMPTRQATTCCRRDFGSWLKQAFALADGIETFAASTIATKCRDLERSFTAILAAPTTCDLARDLQMKFQRVRVQLLKFATYLGLVEPTKNACERALRPAVIQRKVTNGYRAM